MKTAGITSVLLPILVLASLSAGEAQILQPDELCSDQPYAAIATFEDANLAARVRSALSVGAQDDLTCGLVSGITDLEAQNAEIKSLMGIQNLTSLTNLDLWDNSITDISALSGLTSLTTLGFRGNSVSDISALSGLTRLTELNLTFNSISDISALSGLTDLAILRLYNNPITDISPLRGLTSLTELHVHDLPDLITIQPLLNTQGSERATASFSCART